MAATNNTEIDTIREHMESHAKSDFMFVTPGPFVELPDGSVQQRDLPNLEDFWLPSRGAGQAAQAGPNPLGLIAVLGQTPGYVGAVNPTVTQAPNPVPPASNKFRQFFEKYKEKILGIE